MKKPDNTSRRLFLTQSIGILSAALLPWDLLKSENFKGKNLLEKGILFPKNDLPRIKKNVQNPIFKEYWASLVNADLAADTKFLKEELNIRKHFSHLIRSCNILKRSSMVSLIENRKDHEDIAKLAIEKIHTFDVWDYILEGGKDVLAFQCAPEAIISFAVALDFMENKLSASEKEDMLKAISEKGAKSCYLSLFGMRYPDKVKGWAFDTREEIKTNVDLSKWPIILNRTNLKMIPITGLILSSLVLNGKDPESEKWMEMGLWSLKDFATMWEKDGSYPEGVGYSSYSAKHMVLAVDFLNRALERDYNKMINFLGYSRYVLQMSTPFKNYPYGTINFGDNAFSVDSALMYWIASKFKDGITQYYAVKFPSQVSVFSIAWYNDAVKEKEPTPDLMDVKFANDWAVTRSGFTENDTAVGFRSGGPANHEHADRNSIIMNACGERFFHDPLGAAYNNFDKHWLLRQTEAHSAVLIDGKGHHYHDGHEGTNASQAIAKVTQYKPGKKITVVSSDATQAYKLVNDDIKKVQRTIALVKPDILIIVDEMKKNNEVSEMQARFQAFNLDEKAVLKTGTDKNSFEIHRPNARLYAKIESSSAVQILNGQLDVPKDKGIFPYVSISNAKLKDCTMITVCGMVPEKEEKNPEIKIEKVNKNYKVNVRISNREVNLTIYLNEKFPDIRLS